MKFFIFAAFAALGMVNAACPNMCSGHGNCKNDDMCECHRNWMAADCSERVCPYDWAFVTTPQGDLNMDGDIYDAMSYDDDTHYDDSRQITESASATNLLTIQMPGGDWEIWPSYGATTTTVTSASSNNDEGHFYMECSNRGLCDRKTGECECFDGYEGAGCRRTVCANDCSGHGTCESVNALTGGGNYKLWDGDKSMSCKCDPGYGAADCSERKCPTGDDPLTTSTSADEAQRNENVWIDVDQVGSSTSPSNGADISGYIQLQYTDDFGETWWSDFIGPMAKYSGTTADDNALATKIADGFTGIPNGVFEKVTVTAHKIKNILPGTLEGGDDQAGAGALSINTNAAFASDEKWAAAFGCGTATGYCDEDDFPADWELEVDGTSVTIVKDAGWYAATNVPKTGDFGSALDNAGAHQVSLRGIRFKVNFTANSGDLTDFTCVTTDRFSNTETAITDSTCTITSRPVFVGAEADIDDTTKSILVSSDLTGDVAVGDRVNVGTTTFTVDAISYTAADSATTITTVEAATADQDDAAISKNMDGTTESAECSNRGLCDYESGTCQCFQGYTGDDCGTQSTLAW